MKFEIFTIFTIAILFISPITTEEAAAPAEATPPADAQPAPAEAGAEADPNAPAEAGAGAEGGDAAKPEIKKLGVKCKKHLLETYGLSGLRHAEEMKLDMCGAVKNSCCSVPDQLVIYDNWVGAEEGKDLKERLDFHFKIYSEIILELEKAVPIASAIFSVTKGRLVSNCKLLSRRVLEYNINMIGPKVKEAARAMHAFFMDTYKGVYCSMCNGDYQEFFHVEKKTVSISPQFCRSIVSNSLHVLTYYHVHLKRLSNMVAIMLTSCDQKGVFEPQISVPVDLNFVVDEKDQREFSDCLKFKDDPKWMAYCGRICEDFHLTRYSPMFQPDLDKYKRLTKFLRTKFDKFIPEEKKATKKTGKEGEKKDAKEEKKDEKKKDEKKDEKKAERILTRSKFTRDPRLLEEDESEDSEKKDEGEKKDEEKKDDEKKEDDKKEEDDKKDEEKEGEEKEGDDKKEKKSDEPKVDPGDQKPENIMDLKVEWEDLNIIRRSINGKTPLERFNSLCKKEGIDPYEMGKSAQINESTYETVKKLVELMNKKPVLQRKSVMRINVLMVLSLLSFFLWRQN